MKIVDGFWCDDSGKRLKNMFGHEIAAEQWTCGSTRIRIEPIMTPIGWAPAQITDDGKCIAQSDASCVPFDWPGVGNPTIKVDGSE